MSRSITVYWWLQSLGLLQLDLGDSPWSAIFRLMHVKCDGDVLKTRLNWLVKKGVKSIDIIV